MRERKVYDIDLECMIRFQGISEGCQLDLAVRPSVCMYLLHDHYIILYVTLPAPCIFFPLCAFCKAIILIIDPLASTSYIMIILNAAVYSYLLSCHFLLNS